MGLIVLDAGVLIGIASDGDAHHDSARAVVAEARDQGHTLVLPVSAYAEAAVYPHRLGRAAVASFDRFVDAMPIRWAGPTFSSDASDAAVEEVEIAHHGFRSK